MSQSKKQKRDIEKIVCIILVILTNILKYVIMYTGEGNFIQ